MSSDEFALSELWGWCKGFCFFAIADSFWCATEEPPFLINDGGLNAEALRLGTTSSRCGIIRTQVINGGGGGSELIDICM